MFVLQEIPQEQLKRLSVETLALLMCVGKSQEEIAAGRFGLGFDVQPGVHVRVWINQDSKLPLPDKR